MKSLLSIRIDDKQLQAVKTNAHRLQVSQTEYVKRAIELLNQKIERQERKQRLESASQRVREESLRVNQEFGRIEHDPED